AIRLSQAARPVCVDNAGYQSHDVALCGAVRLGSSHTDVSGHIDHRSGGALVAAGALISMPEIAELAGVRRPVVTNWRRRHHDFPAPVDKHHSTLLFDADQVVDWLARTGRGQRSE